MVHICLLKILFKILNKTQCYDSVTHLNKQFKLQLFVLLNNVCIKIYNQEDWCMKKAKYFKSK